MARFTGYSCSDLGNVCKEAAMAPIKDLMTMFTSSNDNDEATLSSSLDTVAMDSASVSVRRISSQDFIKALEVVRPTATDQQEFAGA